jgi:rSAM/selenodomain-associated transferase 1
MANPNTPIPLILFAKQPEPGLVKTRLQPELSLEQAAEVAKILLNKSIELAIQAWQGEVILAVWPDLQHAEIERVLAKYSIHAIQQVEGDLGTKMFQAMQQFGYPCAVMGCDVPHCQPEVLKKTYENMQSGRNVIGPTQDGGYYLLGLQSQHQELFDLNAWGGDTVLAKTLHKAEALGMTFEVLEELQDIDSYTDLCAASVLVPELKQFVL